MLGNILTVSEQILILALLTLVGFGCGRTNVITDEAGTDIARFHLTVIAPCVMISCYQQPYDAEMLQQLLLCFVMGLALYAVGIVVSKLTIRDADAGKVKVLRCSVIFSNCGMLCIALEQALYGGKGAFLGSAFVAAFNIVFWTYGVSLMGHREDASLGKMLLTPCVIGTIIGLALFMLRMSLPTVVRTPIDALATMNTPLCMLIIGQRLSRVRLGKVLRDGKAWLAAGERLVVVPLLTLLALKLLHLNGMPATICVIAASAPVAATATMLAIRYGQHERLSAAIVSMQTILSAVTMPLIIALAQSVL